MVSFPWFQSGAKWISQPSTVFFREMETLEYETCTGKPWDPAFPRRLAHLLTMASAFLFVFNTKQGVPTQQEDINMDPQTAHQNGGGGIPSTSNTRYKRRIRLESTPKHHGTILEPILVVGLGCSPRANRDFDPWPKVMNPHQKGTPPY